MKKTTKTNAAQKPAINNVLKVFAVGSASSLISTVAGACAFVSAKLFGVIPSVNGYLAVGGFALALVAAAAALAMIYVCGAWVVGKGKFSK